MTPASLAYLALVLAAYAVFVGALGLVWLRTSRKRRPAPRIEVTQARSVSKGGPPQDTL